MHAGRKYGGKEDRLVLLSAYTDITSSLLMSSLLIHSFLSSSHKAWFLSPYFSSLLLSVCLSSSFNRLGSEITRGDSKPNVQMTKIRRRRRREREAYFISPERERERQKSEEKKKKKTV